MYEGIYAMRISDLYLNCTKLYYYGNKNYIVFCSYYRH